MCKQTVKRDMRFLPRMRSQPSPKKIMIPIYNSAMFIIWLNKPGYQQDMLKTIVVYPPFSHSDTN